MGRGTGRRWPLTSFPRRGAAQGGGRGEAAPDIEPGGRPDDGEFEPRKGRLQVGRLAGYFRPYAPHVAAALALSAVQNLAILLRPFIVKTVIDDYLTVGRGDMPALTALGLAYFALIALGSAVGFLQTYALTWVGQRIMHTIRTGIFGKVQRMSMKFFDGMSSGRILTRVTNDVEALDEIFSGVVVTMFRDLVLIVGIVAMMFALDPYMATVAVGCVPLILTVVVLYRRAAGRNFVKVKGMVARINAFLAESIQGMKVIQAFNRQDAKNERIRRLNDEFFKYSLREVILNGLCRPVVDIINNLTIAALVFACAGAVLGKTLEIGVLYAFITYVKQFFEPISDLSEKYTSIQSAIVSADRIFEIMDDDAAEEDLEGGFAPEPGAVAGSVEFRDVWFAYGGDDWVLRNFSVTIEPGSTVAFVGATGSGKTTIISLLARFYDVGSGKVLLDGRDIREYNLHSLRKAIAVVQQDVFLFTGDVASNISLNDPIGREAVERAAERGGAAEFIGSLGGGYGEEVMERGCTFSAGERQLISFARALAHDPSILILDEATASIDAITEARLQAAMAKASVGRTVIVIAHRLSTIREADKIVVIEKGEIKETGTHAELLSLDGIYAGMHRALESDGPTLGG
ncbi:MAG: ABC transporter ATP-binding protein/permease [Oscillospiraceae bacterium]|nr:ABC transporter ATP-binding protein/permease [Oscillospiraceae bacterium]